MTDRSDLELNSPPKTRDTVFGTRRVAAALLAIAVLLMGIAVESGRLPFASPVGDLGAASSLWIIFLTGLSVGGMSCLAVQGGLLTATIMRREQRILGSNSELTIGERLGPVVQFLMAKTAAYTLLGATLGYFGSKIPSSVQGWLLIAVGGFMLVVVLQMFDIHPLFRRISFQPPKRVQRMIRAESKKGSAWGPTILGAMTVLIPCGVTIAMEGLAMASESPVRGAMIMLVFTLGTAPLFLGLGYVATHLSRGSFRLFKPVAALLVAVISVYTVLGGMRLLGVTAGVGGSTNDIEQSSLLAVGEEGMLQEATIHVSASAYSPEIVQLRAGIPTRLNMVTSDNSGCTRAFTIPSLGVDVVLPVSGLKVLDLPAVQPGKIVFTCGMGMFSGVLDVVAAVSPESAPDS